MKRGFTLIETVVTVGIVAAMAAVVIPQVAKQFDVADPTRVQNDLKNLQAAMEAYFVNTRVLAADLDDLSNQIEVSGDDSTLTTAATVSVLTGSANTLWKGPYIDLAVPVDADDDVVVPTGYGARIAEGFVCYNATLNENGVTDSTATAPPADGPACPNPIGAGEQAFVAVQVLGIACDGSAGTTFMSINELFDGVESQANAPIAGRIRCAATGAGDKATNKDVVYFLAVPIS